MYKYFVDVVDSKSFTKAGKKNYVTQTAISQQISSLEKSIGGTLIERGNGEITVTELGEIVYEKARQMLEINEQMTREIEQQKEKFVIRIGIDSSINKFFWWKMQEMIDEFYSENEFQFSKVDSFIGSKMLEENALDIYIGYELQKLDKKSKIIDKEVCANPMGVYLSKNAKIDETKKLTLADLKPYKRYATEVYACSLPKGEADIQALCAEPKLVNNIDTMKLKVEFNNGYAFADSKYFSFCDGKMCLLEDFEKSCVLRIFYKESHGQKKLKEVLGRIDFLINE